MTELDKEYAFSTSSLPHTDFVAVQNMQVTLLNTLIKKDGEYGASWCLRGGVGAFFTVWRKADRLLNQLEKREFNMFDCQDDPTNTESLDETIADFANYLMLVLEKRQAIRNKRTALSQRALESGIDLNGLVLTGSKTTDAYPEVLETQKTAGMEPTNYQFGGPSD
jgi:hypothetical protein